MDDEKMEYLGNDEAVQEIAMKAAETADSFIFEIVLPFCQENYQGELKKEDLRRALSLLKAQEPRVMTLEEAAVSDFCYVEYSTGDIIPAFVRFAVMAGEIKSYKIQTDLGHSYFCADKYGKILRCWTARPNEEQRMAVKWE